MRGHITKRSKDSYSIVLDVGTDPITGKRKQQRVSVKGTRKNAEKGFPNYCTSSMMAFFSSRGKVP